MSETFAEEVMRRRKELGITQAQVADLAGVARGTIRNLETGACRTTRRNERDIRRALDLPDAGDGDVPVGVTPIREEIARQIDALADAYPEDALDGDSDLIRGARHAYRMAARIARGEQP